MALNKWTSSQGTTVQILPFFDHGYGFLSIDLRETIGGEIAGGTILLVDNTSKEALTQVINTKTVTIKMENKTGMRMEIQGLITERDPERNYLRIEFLVIPTREFLSDTLDMYHENVDLKELIEKVLLPPMSCEWRDNVMTTVPQDTSINQVGVSRYELLKRVSLGFKKDTVFALGLEGYFLKDIVGLDSHGNREPNMVLSSGQSEEITTIDSLPYNPLIYKSLSPNYGESDWNDFKSINAETYIQAGTYHVIGKKTSILFENYRHNLRFMSSDGYTKLRTRHTLTLPEYKLGDVLIYRRKDIDDHPGNTKHWYEFIVMEKIYHISREENSKYPFYVDSILWGLVDPLTGEELEVSDPNMGWKNQK